MSRILIVEDEPRIAAFVEKGLKANGFATTVSGAGEEALRLLRSGRFDLVILDLGLPDVDGLEVLAELRRRDRRVPVVILTARDSVADTVAGLEGGADDYIAKPFRFEELLARVRVRLRGERAPEETVLTSGDVSLDLRTRQAIVEGGHVELTAREFALAEILFRHPGQVLSREQLLSHVWGYDYDPGSNIVDVYIGYLRKKLGKDRIVSVRGMGYRLDPAARRSGGRVLVIEDEARIAQLVARELRRDGHEVVVAEDGEVGTFLATTERFDLVLLDIGLPGASGLEVLDRLAGQQPELPVVVLTAHDEEEVRRRCLANGAGFLAKPLVLADLRTAVLDRLTLS
jgi:two-component system, OmpR family, copper resistance phosphate regulon response regulator CusR